MRPVDTQSMILRNGEPIAPEQARFDLLDPAVQRGLGLFETLAVRAGRPLDFEAHLERLALGAQRLALELPDRERLADSLLVAAADRPGGEGWIKLILTTGGDWFVFGGVSDPDEEGRPVRALTLPWRCGPAGPLAGLKTLNYGSHAMGLRHAREHGADEGFWFNHRNRLVEGCWSNVFACRGSRLFTPATREGGLPGVVRAQVIAAARSLGLNVHDGPLRVQRLRGADHVFVTSSLRGLCTVTELDGKSLGRPRGAATVAALAGALGRRHRGV